MARLGTLAVGARGDEAVEADGEPIPPGGALAIAPGARVARGFEAAGGGGGSAFGLGLPVAFCCCS